MATKSFYGTMVIDTPEAAANLAKAIEDYGKNGPYVPDPLQGITEDREELARSMSAAHRVFAMVVLQFTGAKR